MNEIKNAFLKVKQDIDSLNKEINNLKQSLSETKIQILEMNKSLNNLISQEKVLKSSPQNPTHLPQNSTVSTHSSTDKPYFKPLKPQNLTFSTGNEGVPTDKQTNRQTNRQTKETYSGDAFEILDSLNTIKKEIRNKFKRITDQEFLVFSAKFSQKTIDNSLDRSVKSL